MSRHVADRERIPCLVPFCRRTVPMKILDTPIGALSPVEALCAKHWRLVPVKWRKVHARAVDHLLVAPSAGALGRSARIWRRIKARALAAALAKMAVALIAVILAGPVGCTSVPPAANRSAAHLVAMPADDLAAVDADYATAAREVAAYVGGGRSVPERAGIMRAMLSAAKGAIEQARRAVEHGDGPAEFAIGLARLAVHQLAQYVRSATAGAWA